MKNLTTALLFSAVAAFAFAGCGETEIIDYSSGQEYSYQGKSKDDSSAVAVFLDFEFDGSLVANSCFNVEQQVENQMLFTIGQLNGDNSVGRLDRLEVTNVTKDSQDDGCHVSYHARIPVAWGNLNNVPERYTLLMPRNLTTEGSEAFFNTYKGGCLDPHAHDVTSGIFWYYYRPARSQCSLNDADVVRMEASVFPSSIQTNGKYPEYHKIWEDDVFEVVAVFGKYKDNATSGDAGIDAYNRFSREVKSLLQQHGMVSEPAEIPFAPGVDMPELSFTAEIAPGKTIKIVSMLIDSVGSADSAFWSRYESLTPTADFVVYNGHAGLGANIRKLARKGKWVTGQYASVCMNGGDTYAYGDAALADAHAEVNPDDPEGTKYLDLVANAMPSFFRSMSGATMALVRNLMDYQVPRTYEQIFHQIDKAEVVLVSGEHDNEFFPGFDGGEGPDVTEDWTGMDEQGTVAADEAKRFETPTLKAGRYEFALSGSGDADLYIRVGEAPTDEVFDCRPYIEGSAETCEVTLTNAAPVHVMVMGWAPTSDWHLIGQPTQ